MHTRTHRGEGGNGWPNCNENVVYDFKTGQRNNCCMRRKGFADNEWSTIVEVVIFHFYKNKPTKNNNSW